MHPITNTLCVDDPRYEKALKTFSQYCNLQRFYQRVQSMETLHILKGGKQGERATIFRAMPSYSSLNCPKSSKAERELFKKSI